MKLLVNSTPIALWHDIVSEAQRTCAISLGVELEAYLVVLLMRYTNKPEVIKKIIATQFLQSKRLQALQDVGDQCLLFSGLFPNLAEKRLVKISYFVNLGRTAYNTMSKKNND